MNHKIFPQNRRPVRRNWPGQIPAQQQDVCGPSGGWSATHAPASRALAAGWLASASSTW